MEKKTFHQVAQIQTRTHSTIPATPWEPIAFIKAQIPACKKQKKEFPSAGTARLVNRRKDWMNMNLPLQKEILAAISYAGRATSEGLLRLAAEKVEMKGIPRYERDADEIECNMV